MPSTISAGTTAGTAIAIAGDTTGNLAFQTNGTTTAMTINTSQGVSVLNCLAVGNATPSTSGAGITFPATQSASTDANTLDDYEEGTWTPNIGGNATYLANAGFYRKIGSLVFISAYIWVQTRGTGSTTIISGLPFNPGAGASINESVFAVSKADNLSVSITWIGLRNNGTDIYATYRTSASTSGQTNQAYIQNNTELNFSGCYLIY